MLENHHVQKKKAGKCRFFIFLCIFHSIYESPAFFFGYVRCRALWRMRMVHSDYLLLGSNIKTIFLTLASIKEGSHFRKAFKKMALFAQKSSIFLKCIWNILEQMLSLLFQFTRYKKSVFLETLIEIHKSRLSSRICWGMKIHRKRRL